MDSRLDVKYEKDAEKQYIIIEGQETEEYSMKMLQSNKIQGMLEVQVKTIDNQKWYYYNITKQSSLEQLLEKKQISLELVEIILIQIFQTIETSKNFLLDERNLVLDAKMIYLSTDYPGTIEICYYPSYQKDNMEQLIELLEVFLNQINYKEEKSKVEQFYRIYDKARETGMTCKELWKEIQKEYNKMANKLEEDQRPASPAFHFQRVETVKAQPIQYAELVEENSVPIEQKVMEKETTKKEVNKKQEDKKSYIWKNSVEKQKSRGRIQNSNDLVKNMLPLCFLAIFSLTVIGTALFTSIFRNAVTGTLEYSKFGIVCIIVVIMDLFAWRYLRQTETEKKDLPHQPSKNGLIKNEFLGKDVSGCSFNSSYIESKQEHESVDIETKDENVEMETHMKFEREFLKSEQSDPLERESAKPKLEEIQTLIEESTMLLPQEQTVLLKPVEKVWRLVSLEENEPREILLKKFPFYLGKLQWNVDYAIDHPSISRIHSKFEKEGDDLYMTDLDSTNGTYLNHIKLDKDVKQRIKVGDEISFADMKFRLELKSV